MTDTATVSLALQTMPCFLMCGWWWCDEASLMPVASCFHAGEGSQDFSTCKAVWAILRLMACGGLGISEERFGRQWQESPGLL